MLYSPHVSGMAESGKCTAKVALSGSRRQAPSKQSGRVGTATRPAMSGMERVIRPRSPDMHVFLATGVLRAPCSAPVFADALARQPAHGTAGPTAVALRVAVLPPAAASTAGAQPSICCELTASLLLLLFCMFHPVSDPLFGHQRQRMHSSQCFSRLPFWCCVALCTAAALHNAAGWAATTCLILRRDGHLRSSNTTTPPRTSGLLLACLRAGRSASTQGTMDLG